MSDQDLDHDNLPELPSTDLTVLTEDDMEIIEGRPVAGPPMRPYPGAAGRKPVILDRKLIQRLSEIQCNINEIAFALGCSHDTINKNYREDVEIGREIGKLKLKRAMWRNAIEENNTVAQIWLSKNVLGYSDQGDRTDPNNGPLPWDDSRE